MKMGGKRERKKEKEEERKKKERERRERENSGRQKKEGWRSTPGCNKDLKMRIFLFLHLSSSFFFFLSFLLSYQDPHSDDV